MILGSKNSKDAKAAQPTRPALLLKCDKCSKEFEKDNWSVVDTRAETHYCSSECQPTAEAKTVQITKPVDPYLTSQAYKKKANVAEAAKTEDKAEVKKA
jgi:hypothetical protein